MCYSCNLLLFYFEVGIGHDCEYSMLVISYRHNILHAFHNSLQNLNLANNTLIFGNCLLLFHVNCLKFPHMFLLPNLMKKVLLLEQHSQIFVQSRLNLKDNPRIQARRILALPHKFSKNRFMRPTMWLHNPIRGKTAQKNLTWLSYTVGLLTWAYAGA